MRPRATVAIPLFRSAPFIDNVSANIEALPADVEILVSDRHRHDQAIDTLRRRHQGDRRLRFFERLDGKDWIDHLNSLIAEARGEYWRFMPHDDFCDSKSFASLVDCLESHRDILLAYGPTTAVDVDGNRLPDRDTPTPHPIGNEDPWFLGLALDSFSRGHFNGAFKGLIRRHEIIKHRLFIRRTFGGYMPNDCGSPLWCSWVAFDLCPRRDTSSVITGKVPRLNGSRGLSMSSVCGANC